MRFESAAILLLASAGMASAHLAAVTAGPMLPMTKDKAVLSEHAAYLSHMIYVPDQFPSTITVHFSEDLVDAVALEDKDSYCFVAYRGTMNQRGIIIRDWLSNADMRVTQVHNRQDTQHSCPVHNGFYGSYTGKDSYHAEVDTFIDSCMAQPGKQLVFTGHSQGGAAAGIAAAANAGYTPLTITFGQPPFYGRGTDSCPLIHSDHIWRFINTQNSDGFMVDTIKYDPVTVLKALDENLGDSVDWLGSHVGASIHLPPGNAEGVMEPATTSVAAFGKEEPNMDIDTIQIGGGSAHSMLNAYYGKMVTLVQSVPDGGVLDTSGFVHGSMCYFDEECTEGECVNYHCDSGSSVGDGAGAQCYNGDDCDSGRCEMSGSIADGLGACYDTVESGGWCNEHSDCESGTCGRWYTCN